MRIIERSRTTTAAAAMLLSVACGGKQEAEPSGASEDSLRVVEMDEAAGKLVVEFAHEKSRITYDMRLGPRMELPPSAEELAANPELPTYQADVRISDAQGQPFHLQMGGDGFIDPSWRMPHVENFVEAQRIADIASLRKAVEPFRHLSVPASLDQLRFVAMDIGLGVEVSPNKPDSDASDPIAPADAQPVVPAGTVSLQGIIETGAPTSVVKWDFVVRKKPATALGFVGDHSAVELRGWTSSSVIVFRASSANHGTAASSSTMSTHCVMSGFRSDDGTHTRFFYNEMSGTTGTRLGGCSTGYRGDSSFGGHNCNDDSELQGRAAFNDRSYSTNSGNPCASTGLHNYAPGCSY